MANTSDKRNGTIGLKSKTLESSDIVERTDELEHRTHGVDDDSDELLEYSMPEFRIPTGSNPAVASQTSTAPSPRKEPEDEVFAGMEEISELVDERKDSPRGFIEPAAESEQEREELRDPPLDAADEQVSPAETPMLADQRFAPDVIVEPPRTLTKQWREGSPLPGARPAVERPRVASGAQAVLEPPPSGPKAGPAPHRSSKVAPVHNEGEEAAAEERALAEEVLRARPKRIKKRARTMKGRFE
ncbi:MAG: hypothetical protein AAGI01_18160, partial [Myxococcota bacterium]